MDLMALTPHDFPGKSGWIEVICGSMFSGKTEELIRRLRRAEIAKLKVKIFKHAGDIRYNKKKIVSHSEQSIESTPINQPEEIFEFIKEDIMVVGIDEAQFFPPSIVNICDQLANAGKRVIVAGLDQDYRGAPFGPIPQLLAIAEYITKVHAICTKCGNPANHSKRISNDKDQVLIGGKEHYEARCRRCFQE